MMADGHVDWMVVGSRRSLEYRWVRWGVVVGFGQFKSARRTVVQLSAGTFAHRATYTFFLIIQILFFINSFLHSSFILSLHLSDQTFTPSIRFLFLPFFDITHHSFFFMQVRS